MRYEFITAVKVEFVVFCCGVPCSVEDEVPKCRRKRCCSATLCAVSARFTVSREERPLARRCVQCQPDSRFYVKKGHTLNSVIVQLSSPVSSCVSVWRS
jgi:hypothetical protein